MLRSCGMIIGDQDQAMEHCDETCLWPDDQVIGISGMVMMV